MSNLEGGEFIRNRDLVEREKSVNEKIFDIYFGMRIQNNHPSFSEQPTGILYWKGDRLESVKQGLETMETLARENEITEITNPFNTEEKVNLQEFMAQVRSSIEYSEQIAEQAKSQPEVSEEEKANRRAEMKRRLLGENN